MSKLQFLRTLPLVLVLLMVSLGASAQMQVEGTVSSATDGEPLIGVSITETGTQNAAVTDLDGHFAIKVQAGARLLFSYVGFESQTLAAAPQLAVKLKEEGQNLQEVVVVGFGTQKKVNLTGSVASVDSKQLENRGVTSVASALQGALPGVTIVNRSGQPGLDDGGTSVRVRGTGTFNQAAPMVVVDGIESTLYDLDPNDIESVSVLKDAASAAIYGSKAANGVILVTTKHGKSGRAVVRYSGTVGWQSPTDLPHYVSSAQYARLTNEARAGEGLAPLYTDEDIRLFEDGTDPDHHANTDWLALLYDQSGIQTTHNLNIAGGTDDLHYMASTGYQNVTGILRGVDKKQYNMRLNLDGNFSKRLSGTFNMAYSRQDICLPTHPKGDGGDFSEIIRIAKRTSPMVPYRYSDGSYGYIGDGNCIAWLDSESPNDQTRNNLQMAAQLKYQFLPEFSLKAMLAYKFYYGETHEMRKAVRFSDTFTQGGVDRMREYDMRDDRVAADILAEYHKTFAARHNVAALAGYHAELYRFRELWGSREDFPNAMLGDLNAGSTAKMQNGSYRHELSMLSWFGRVNYDFCGRYLFEANVRYDGSSRFADGHRWGVFPSVSAGWRLSEEKFFEPLTRFIAGAKLRASWGKLGNQDVGSYYPTVSTLTLGKGYPFGGVMQQGAVTTKAVNRDLRWETTTTYGVGLDLTLWHNLNITLDWYNKTTDGILMLVSTPMTFALEDYYANVGRVSNKGFELSASWRGRVGKVGYTVGGNVAFNRNRIETMGDVREQISGGNADYNTIMRTGCAMNSFYGYVADGFFQSEADIDSYAARYNIGYTPQPGDLRYKDMNGDGAIDPDDRCVLGSWDPGITFGLNLGASWQGFDLTANFQGAADVKGYISMEGIGYINGDTAKPTTLWLDHWTPDNPNAAAPRLIQGYSGWSMPTTTSTFWQQNAAYLRLKTLQVGYTLPRRWLDRMHIATLRLFYTAENLLTITSFMDGYDPEAPSGLGNYYPQTKTHSIGLNITF